MTECLPLGPSTPTETCTQVAGQPSLSWFVFNEENDVCIVRYAHIQESGEVAEELVPVNQLLDRK